MSDRLDHAFSTLDQLDPPDQWPEIERRVAAGPAPLAVVEDGRAHRARWLVAAVALVVVAASAVVALAVNDEDPNTQVKATNPGGPATSTAPVPSTDPPSPAGDTSVTCTWGLLLPGDAPGESEVEIDVQRTDEESAALIWHEDGHDVRASFLTIGPATDSFGPMPSKPGEVLPWGEGGAIRLSGLQKPCEALVVSVTPIDAEAGAIASGVVRQLRVDPEDNRPDCGGSSGRGLRGPLDVVDPAEAATSVLDELTGAPGPFEVTDTGIPSEGTPDHCAVVIEDPGRLQILAVVTGPPGAYTVVSFSGYDGAADAPLSIRVHGTEVEVDLAYTCGVCVNAEMTIDYGDGIAAEFRRCSVEPRCAGPVTADGVHLTATLPSAPPPDVTGALLVQVKDPSSRVHAIVGRAIPGGDFAAG